MSSRRLRSVRDHARAGRGTGGQRRFGWYGPDASAGRSTNSVLNPAEAPYLRGAIDMALAGKSWTAITDWLAEEEVPTVRNSRWAVDTVQSMVTNPAICGYRIVDGGLVLDRRTGEPVVGNWQSVATPEEWWKLIGRCGRWHSPGIDGPTYKQTYAARREARPEGDGPHETRRRAETERKYLLAGFLRCGYPVAGDAMCGCKMGGQPARGTNRNPSYRCVAAKCRKVGRRTDLVDAYVECVALRALEERYGEMLPDERPFPADAQLAVLRAQQPTPEVKMQIRDLETDRRHFLAGQEDRNVVIGVTPARWATYDIRQKRLALARVIDEVVIRPIPAGRTRNAPFDSELVDVVLKKER